ncbi:MAG: 30S ribosomal protein S1 [Hormoscilla sp. GM7CHS1pb]|nr:30S ribosomal protein S1 [Hormoscilla sp. GM7CHS1pb]
MNSQETAPNPTKESFSMDDFAQALEAHDYNFQKGQVVRGKVEVYDEDGIYVEIGAKSTAFLPMSEVAFGSLKDKDIKEVLPQEEELDFLIVREQNDEGQVTLSRRQLEIKRLWEKLIEIEENKQSLQVIVTGSNKGGVTVDVEGLRGFIPRSHLIDRDNLEALKGESLNVSFLEVNPETKKLVLSQRIAAQSASFSELELGQLVKGKIANIKPFGVFVDLGGSTALLHVKQISQNYVPSLSDLFQMGQEIKAMIINQNEGRSRISLSTKVLENYPGEMIKKMSEVMATAEARKDRAAKKILEKK